VILPARADSPWIVGLCAVLTLGVTLYACEGTVGPCAGQDCPLLPGCEGEAAVACDPEHVCIERVCEGLGWICGVDAKGTYGWARSAAPCDDHNLCTTSDLCVGGACVGKLKDCSVPPPPQCKDSATLQTWEGGGCVEGECQHKLTELSCPQNDCTAGACQSDPCFGKKCDTPPNGCYEPTGTCSAGTCTYAPRPADTPCTQEDKCITSTKCDGQGKCVGTALDCSKLPNVAEGTCVAGECQGIKCASGWGNCNTAQPGGWKDGCEIPINQANKCNKSGLQTPWNGACGTAHCGGTGGSYNFATWHCHTCSHCHKYSNGYAWCLGPSNGGVGNFSSDRCPLSGADQCCNDTKTDLVCK
jgi:hypothetical protein